MLLNCCAGEDSRVPWKDWIKPVNVNGNQPSMLFGRTDAEAEAPILWSSDAKSQLLGKDPVGGKD